jgi:adenylate cyclase
MRQLRWYLPFKYKLTVLINSIVMIVLGGLFVILQGYIENNAITTIKADLKNTKIMVSRLLQDRQIRLEEIARGLGGAELIRVILTDTTLDQVTRDDIVETEILPDYPQIHLLGVIDPNGTLLAINQAGQSLSQILPAQESVQASLEGERSNGFLIEGSRLVQIVTLPLTIGDVDAAEIIGTLVVGMSLSQDDLERIKALSEADLLFFQANRIFLSTAVHLRNNHQPSPQELSVFSAESNAHEEPVVVLVHQERFLYLTVAESGGKMPPYIVAKSLDQQLTFVHDLRKFMLQFGIGGLLAGVIIGYLFARGISRPIKSLQIAAAEVEQGNLTHRVTIRSRDEFSRLGHAFNQMIQGLNEKERIRGIMNKVVSKEIADEILNSNLQLGGEERTATILFSDIRGFTTLSEALRPGALVDLLNQYFTRIHAVIDAHRGNIDKYIGDAIMALFGAPIAHDDDPRQAVLAAIDMIAALHEFNQTLVRDLGKTLQIGIGINTGRLIAGLMGAATRLEYTVMGDTVNLASRLEGLTKYYGVQIMISEFTYQAIQATVSASQPAMTFRELDTVQVKGKTTGVKIYQVFAGDERVERLEDYLVRFQNARQLLEASSFQESAQRFSALTADWPEDRVTQVFAQRAATYLQNPALYQQDYRDGVYIFTEK